MKSVPCECGRNKDLNFRNEYNDTWLSVWPCQKSKTHFVSSESLDKIYVFRFLIIPIIDTQKMQIIQAFLRVWLPHPVLSNVFHHHHSSQGSPLNVEQAHPNLHYHSVGSGGLEARSLFTRRKTFFLCPFLSLWPGLVMLVYVKWAAWVGWRNKVYGGFVDCKGGFLAGLLSPLCSHAVARFGGGDLQSGQLV